MKFDNFKSFIDFYGFIGLFILEIIDLELLLKDLISYLKANNIVHAEVIISLGDYIRNGINIQDIFSILLKYKEENSIIWIVDFVRDNGAQHAERLIKPL